MEMLEFLASIVGGILLLFIGVFLFIWLLPFIGIGLGILLYLKGYPWLGFVVGIVIFLIGGIFIKEPVEVKVKN